MYLNRQTQQIFLSLVILFIAFYTYFYNYDIPARLFWDENYHISSAYKYLNHIFFMEPHPPLGKLLIALGEWLSQVFFNTNAHIDNTALVSVEHIKDTPLNFSFAGVRFFPVLFSVFSAVLFFHIIIQLLKNHWMAFLLSAFYLFDNAIIVHSRSAMLESIQIFFILGAIYYFLLRLEKQNFFNHYFILGIFIGLAVAVKVNSLILLLLFPFLFFYPYFNQNQLVTLVVTGYDFIKKGVSFTFGIIFIFFLSFYIHFSLATELLDNHYDVPPEYLTIIKNKQTSHIENYGLMLKANLAYMAEYEKKVPRYKPYDKDEAGSLAFAWPFLHKAISYRWDKNGANIRHVYLQANPLIWFFSLIGVTLALVYLLATVFFGLAIKDKKNFYLMAGFSCMYLSYMFVMFQIERVMYLYHYFIPLLFSMFLLFLVFKQLFLSDEPVSSNSPNRRLIYVGLIILAVEIFYTFSIFKPLSHYQSISVNEFERLKWFDYWHLENILH